MTAYDAATYRRARADGQSAGRALALARWIATVDRDNLPDYGAPATIERDGFTIRLSLDYDEALTLADLGYGRFLEGGHDWRQPDRTTRPDPNAVPNPYRDTRNVSGGDGWYLPAVTLAERFAEYHRCGASKSVALDLARESLAEEVRYLTDDYGPSVYVLTATAFREGIRLGSQSVGGIDIAWSDITQTDGREYLAEIAEDIIPEAIHEAQDALERLVPA